MGRPPARGLARVRMSGTTPACSYANILPVRPSPHCTSSKARSAPLLAADGGHPLQELGRRGPHSALALHRLEHHRRGLVGGRRLHRGRGRPRARSGPRGRAARRARGTSRSRWWRARPWSGRGRSARSRRTRTGPASRPMRRANFMAPSHASVPELQKKTLEGKARATRRSASAARGLGVEQVARVDQLAGLLADGLHDGAVAIAEAVDRDPGREVEVGPALLVEEPRALAGDEGDVAFVDGEERAHARTSLRAGARMRVPAKPPRRRALPATTTSGMPAAAASRATRTLRLMPPAMVPSAMRREASSASRASAASPSNRTPSTSER